MSDFPCPFCRQHFDLYANKWTCPHCGKRICNFCMGLGVLGELTSVNSTTCGICQSTGERPEIAEGGA